MNNLIISSITQSVLFNGVSIANLPNLPIPELVKNLYWSSESSTGWIENLDAEGNYVGNTDISELPQWANTCISIFQQNLPVPPTPPTPIELCKIQAKVYLQNTDWSEIPSVSDAQNTPHLLNVSEFITYRNLIRNYVVNPVADPVWPTEPTAQWS